MCITFHFCHFFDAYPLNETVDINKKAVQNVISAFSKEERKLIESQEPLIFFDDTSNRIRKMENNLGVTIKRHFVEYDNFVTKFRKKILHVSDFSKFSFIIWISNGIAEDPDVEYKTMTIAHEFQHILQ
jgi:hypothetical protein